MKKAVCTNCQNILEVPEHYLGTDVKCSECGASFLAAVHTGPVPSRLNVPPPKLISPTLITFGLVVFGVIIMIGIGGSIKKSRDAAELEAYRHESDRIVSELQEKTRRIEMGLPYESDVEREAKRQLEIEREIKRLRQNER